MRRGKRYKQRQCRHLNAWGIYGDGINVMRGRRGFCGDCGLVLDALPMKVDATDTRPTPCKPDGKGRLVVDDFYLRIIAKASTDAAPGGQG